MKVSQMPNLSSMDLSMDWYEVRARRDRHKHGGGFVGFVRQDFICKKSKKIWT